MPPVTSSYRDLHRIFRSGITVRDIAEPLVTFEAEFSSDRLREFMETRDYDVAGVRHDGLTTGYVLRHELGQGPISKFSKPFEDNSVIDESAPLLDTLTRLAERRWAFVRFLGNPSGIVTRGDLQKAPMRLWLFGLISLLEMHLLRLIREEYPGDEWRSYLTEPRLEAAQQVLDLRRQANDAIDLAECLQICDKKTIFGKSPALSVLFKPLSKPKWKRFMAAVEQLRNALAHSNPIASTDWPRIADLTKTLERMVERLEIEGSGQGAPVEAQHTSHRQSPDFGESSRS